MVRSGLKVMATLMMSVALLNIAGIMVPGVDIGARAANGKAGESGNSIVDKNPQNDWDEAAQRRKIEMNSQYCGSTLFTPRDDKIDFASSFCIDMQDGNDEFELKDKVSKTGLEIHSGYGRDIVHGTTGPDKIFDFGGEDELIMSYDGNDEITIDLPVTEEPSREVETTGKTDLFPGSGNNRTVIGKNIEKNSFARFNPEVRYHLDGQAKDEIDAVCGRPFDNVTTDISVEKAERGGALKIRSFGCGVDIFGDAGLFEIDQTGGVSILRSRLSGLRSPDKEYLPRFSGEVHAGTSLYLDLSLTDPSSNFKWTGNGDVHIQSRVKGSKSGGHYDISTAGAIEMISEPGASSVNWSLVSGNMISVEMTGTEKEANEVLSLTAPTISLSWTYRNELSFPKIITPIEREMERQTFDPIDVDFYFGNIIDKSMSMVSKDQRIHDMSETAVRSAKITNATLPKDVKEYEMKKSSQTIKTGRSSLILDLSAGRSEGRGCFEVRVVDREHIHPDQIVTCNQDEAIWKEFDNTADFEEIRIKGPEELSIEINGETGFRLNDLIIGL